MILSIDLETRSTVNLKRAGVHAYAEDPTTDVWCAAFCIDNGPVMKWVRGNKTPAPIVTAVEAGWEIRAWNAQFERVMWQLLHHRYGWPIPEGEKFVCTMAEAAALALPLSLEKCGKALGLEIEKDMDGRRLMMQMSKPRRRRKSDVGEGPFWWDEDHKLKDLVEYCRRDVQVERAIAAKLRPLPERERRIYLLDQKINERGVYIDRPLIDAAAGLMERAINEANRGLVDVTDGAVSTVTQHGALTEWLQEKGVETDNVQKATVRDLLETDLDPEIEAALTIRAEAGKTSTAKLAAMKDAASLDGRVRGLYQYHAATTGRFGGRRVQQQNFPRPTVKVEPFIDLVLDGDYTLIDMEHPVPHVVSSMLRSMLRAAPGRVLTAGDYAQIEARVLAWLAGQKDLVDLFARGGLVYEDMAAYIYGVPVEDVTPEQRQIGKNAILGAGFQMGADRFAEQVHEQTGVVLDRGEVRTNYHCTQCKGWASPDRPKKGNFRCPNCTNNEVFKKEVVIRPDMAARAIDGYREKNHRIKQFWWDLNDAAIAAVRHPGSVQTVGRIKYTKRGAFLWCRLPSGRFLAYPKPQLKMRKLPKPYDDVEKLAVSYMSIDSYTRKWKRVYTYGGHLTENVVQATARDLLTEAMLNLDAAGHDIVMHTHDEVVVEGEPEKLTEILEIMEAAPGWADGLPIKAEGWEQPRYRK